MTDSKDILNALRNKEIVLDNLSGSIVEDLIKFKVEEDASHTNSIVKQFKKKGPIDIVVYLETNDPLEKITKTRTNLTTIFIECKHHKRDLELDVVAKVFCISIVEQPNKLIIMTSSKISPQASECAKYLFKTEGISDNMFGIQFIEHNIYDFLDIPLVERNLIQNKSISWYLKVDTPIETNYYDTNVDININYNEKYSLVLTDIFDSNFDLSQLKITINIYNLIKQITEYKTEIRDNKVTLILYFDYSFFERTKNKKKKFNITINEKYYELFKYKFDTKFPVIPDFREEYTEDISKSFSENNNKKILFISGLGGVGKSYLIEKISMNMKKQHQSTFHNILINEEFSSSFFKRFILHFMLPYLPTITIDDNEINTFLRSWINNNTKRFNKSIIPKLTRSSLDFKNIDSLSLYCALIIHHSKIFNLIVISDLHKADTTTLNFFKFLLLYLEEFGWGKNKIIFEYRNEDEILNQNIQNFQQNLQKEIKYNKIDKVELQNLKLKDVTNTLNKLFINNEIIFITNSIIKKAGGNPFLIIQLLYHFLAQNYISYNEEFNKLKIIDFKALENDLLNLPNSINEIMDIRMNTFIESIKKNRQKNLIIKFLLFSSYYDYYINNELLLKLLECNEDNLYKIRNILINNGILNNILGKSSLCFIHEIMYLSVQNNILKYVDYKLLLKKLLNEIDTDKVLNCLRSAKIEVTIGNMQNSLNYYDKAQEIAKISGELALRSKALKGYFKTLNNFNILHTKEFLYKLISSGLDLADVQIQTNSQIDALLTLKEVFDHLSFLDNPEKDYYHAIFYKNKLTLLVRMLQAKSFFKVFKESNNYFFDNYHILKSITRFILMCSHIDKPHIAWYGIKHIVILANNLEKELGNKDHISSLYSDIGRLYLRENPIITKYYWEKGNKLACSRIQKSHSELNVLIAKLYADNYIVNEEYLEVLEKNIQEQSVENQICRLYNYLGIINFKTDTLKSINYFSEALKKSQMVNQPYWEWKSLLNLAICKVLLNEEETAYEYFISISMILNDFINSSFIDNNEIKQLFDSVKNKYNLTSSFGTLKNIQTSPKKSGLYKVYLYNLTQVSNHFKTKNWLDLQKKYQIVKNTPIKLKRNSVLKINVNNINLIFALE